MRVLTFYNLNLIFAATKITNHMSQPPELLPAQNRIPNIRVDIDRVKAAAEVPLISFLKNGFTPYPLALSMSGGPDDDAVTLQATPRFDMGRVMQFDFLHQVAAEEGDRPYYGQGVTVPVIRFAMLQNEENSFSLMASQEGLNRDFYSDEALQQAFELWFKHIILEAWKEKSTTFTTRVSDIPTLKMLMNLGFECPDRAQQMFAEILLKHEDIADVFAIQLKYQTQAEPTSPPEAWC